MKNILLLLILISASPAGAATLKCASTDEIDQGGAKSCEDNQAFAEAAVSCLNELKSQVEKAKAEAKAALAANGTHAEKDQLAALNKAAKGYGISAAKLDELLDLARQAGAQVDQYLKDLYLPDDYALVENPQFDEDEVLLSNPCFADPQETLLMVEQDIDQISDDFTAAKMASTAMQKINVRSEGRQSTEGTAKVKAGATKGPAPKGKEIRRSDVSGTEEKKPK